MKTLEFIALLYSYAISDQLRSGVLASITISQGILESASGNSAPGNNLFGIKGQGQMQETRDLLTDNGLPFMTALKFIIHGQTV